MSKHTPGPWTIEKDTSDEFEALLIIGPSKDPDLKIEPLAKLLYCDPEDARLIAAAPDLLEACKKALENLEGDAQEDDERGDAIRSCVAAIAKAEGK